MLSPNRLNRLKQPCTVKTIAQVLQMYKEFRDYIISAFKKQMWVERCLCSGLNWSNLQQRESSRCEQTSANTLVAHQGGQKHQEDSK